jgi:transposase-like protein
MSAKRKQSAVLRLLRGEDLELVSRELGVMAGSCTESSAKAPVRRGHGMRVMFEVTGRMHTMPRGKLRPTLEEVKALLAEDRDFLRPLVQAVVQELLEAEMTEALGAEKGERSAARLGYRSGYYDRTLVSRVGKLELRVPQDRHGRFSTELFERYQRSEKALVAALAEMYVQGVSTRKVKAITEELCGHSFSASAISAINVKLDDGLAEFARRRLDEACPYLILDARYERVREAGVIRSQAVLLAIGINWDGRRSILAVELANRESRSSWREFLLQLRERGLSGVEFVVSDDHAGLRQAIVEVLPEAAWQRCYVHFLRNALDYVPRKVDDDCLRELRWLYDRRDLAEAKRDLAAWLAKWQATYPKLCAWVEEHIEETLTFYRLPRQHHKHLKSTNLLERLNEEIKRRTHVVRIFPNAESCLRLVRALAVEMHENWLEAHRYLNMDDLREHKKEALRMAA